MYVNTHFQSSVSKMYVTTSIFNHQFQKCMSQHSFSIIRLKELMYVNTHFQSSVSKRTVNNPASASVCGRRVVVRRLLCLYIFPFSSIQDDVYIPSASAHCVCVVALCVSLCQSSFVCGRHSIFYVFVTCCDLDVTIRLSERKREGRTTTSRVYHQKEKKK